MIRDEQNTELELEPNYDASAKSSLRVHKGQIFREKFTSGVSPHLLLLERRRGLYKEAAYHLLAMSYNSWSLGRGGESLISRAALLENERAVAVYGV